MKLEYIKGRDLVDALNDAENLIPDYYDEMYGYKFKYESQYIKNGKYHLHFSIENGHYIKGNTIVISKDLSFNISLQDPFDGGGLDSEIPELLKVFIANLEISLRDNKIVQILESESENENRLKVKILEKLEDLTKKIKDNEDLPESNQDVKFLSEVDDHLETILNAWYY